MYDTVIAEEAPIGVQLWPTISPEFSPAFTLTRVETVRTMMDTYIRWVYENGSTRVFAPGTPVVVKIDRRTETEESIIPAAKARRVLRAHAAGHITESETVIELAALLGVDASCQMGECPHPTEV